MKDIFARIRNLEIGYRIIFFIVFLLIFFVIEWAIMYFIGGYVKTWMIAVLNIVIVIYLAFQTLRSNS